MGVAAKRSDACASIVAERVSETAADFWVAGSAECDEVGAIVQAGIKIVRAHAGQEGHRSRSIAWGQWEHELSRLESCKPGRLGMSGPGAGDNHVRGFKRAD